MCEAPVPFDPGSMIRTFYLLTRFVALASRLSLPVSLRQSIFHFPFALSLLSFFSDRAPSERSQQPVSSVVCKTTQAKTYMSSTSAHSILPLVTTSNPYTISASNTFVFPLRSAVAQCPWAASPRMSPAIAAGRRHTPSPYSRFQVRKESAAAGRNLQSAAQ